jgi:hypothetical protein
LAVPIRAPIEVLTRIHIFIRKIVSSLSILERPCPLAFIFIAVEPLMDSVAPDLVVSPLTHVRVILKAFPYAKTVFRGLNPFAIIDFSVGPSVNSLAMRFVVHEGASIDITILVSLIPLPILFIFKPLSFINSRDIMN